MTYSSAAFPGANSRRLGLLPAAGSWQYQVGSSGTHGRWLDAQHDDGHPADGHVDHAVRNAGFGDKEVVTCTGPHGTRRRSYAEAGERAARLAGALRRLGVDGDQRVATFMWNNAEHLEAYLAMPSMGAVMHTLNIRLSPDQVGYIATHAEDYAVIVDDSLVPIFAEILQHAPGIRHVIVTGAPPAQHARSTRRPGGRSCTRMKTSWPLPRHPSPGRPLDERSAAAMCYTSGTTGLPKGVVYSHRSTYLHSLGPCMANGQGVSEYDRVLPVVPMFHANAWGLPYACLMSGAELIMPDKFMSPAAVVSLIEREQVTFGAGSRPSGWRARPPAGEGGDISSLRMLPRAARRYRTLMRAYQNRVRRVHAARLGDDRTSPLGTWPTRRPE